MLGGHAASLHLEFLQRIRKGHLHAHAGNKIDMSGAIQTIVHAVAQSACDRDVIHAREILRERRIRHDGAAGQRDQIGHLASVERQLQNSRILDNLAHTGASRFHQSRVCLNLDLLSDLTDVKDHVDHRIAVDLQHNSSLYKRTKSRQSRLQPIGTKRQVWQHVQSGLIANRVSTDTRVRLRHCDFRARQHSPALIPDRAADLSCRLRPDERGTKNGSQRSHRQTLYDTLHTVF